MHHFIHPADREIKLTNGQLMIAKFREMFVTHIDNSSVAFGKTAKNMRIGIAVIAAVEATKPGEVISLEDEHFTLVKDVFENAEKYNIALPMFLWRHVFDWVEAIINATDKRPPTDNVTPIKASKAGK